MRKGRKKGKDKEVDSSGDEMASLVSSSSCAEMPLDISAQEEEDDEEREKLERTKKVMEALLAELQVSLQQKEETASRRRRLPGG